MSITKESIVGRVITLESVKYAGKYADSNPSKKLLVSSCSEADLLNALWTRFSVHETSNGDLAFESVRYPKHYFDANPDGLVHITYSSSVPSGDWGRWKLHVVAGSVIALESRRYSGSFNTATSSNGCQTIQGSSSETKNQWRVSIGPGLGPVKDLGTFLVTNVVNTGSNSNIAVHYERTVGISVNEGTSGSVTELLGDEVKTNFTGGDFSIGTDVSIEGSDEWAGYDSDTWTEAQETIASVIVPPRTKVRIYQRKGSYSGMTVYSSITKEETPY